MAEESRYFWNPTGEQLEIESDPRAIAELKYAGYIEVNKKKYDEIKREENRHD